MPEAAKPVKKKRGRKPKNAPKSENVKIKGPPKKEEENQKEVK